MHWGLALPPTKVRVMRAAGAANPNFSLCSPF
jgi:hypothetical protein